MPTIQAYPAPGQALASADLVLGFAGGATVSIPLSMISEFLLEGLVASVPAVLVAALPAALNALVNGLPDEANGDATPSAGLYLSAGVLKFA